jgi:hypothetical protein
MDTNDLRARAARLGIAERSDRLAAQRPSSALIVVGVSLAIVGAVLAVASSPDHVVSMVIGLGLFITGAAIGVASASSLPHALTVTAHQSDVGTGQAVMEGASTPWRLPDLIASVQFGPDPEQVIGRQTGART